MKAKVILYGWAISWLFLLAGADTMEYGNFAVGGSALCGMGGVQPATDRKREGVRRGSGPLRGMDG